MSGSIQYGDSNYSIPDFGDKLRPEQLSIDEEKFRGAAERERIEQEASQALQKVRDTYNALSPQGPAWSPNDSQFYNPDDVPTSIDTDLAPKPPMILVVLVFGLAIYFLKGK